MTKKVGGLVSRDEVALPSLQIIIIPYSFVVETKLCFRVNSQTVLSGLGKKIDR